MLSFVVSSVFSAIGAFLGCYFSDTTQHLIHELLQEMQRKEEVELVERELTNFLAISSNYQNIAKTSFSEFLAAPTKETRCEKDRKT